MFKFKGQKRPDFAEQPAPGQESVWDYPRPPELRSDSRRVEVEFGSEVIASTLTAVRVCETASPPTFYIDPQHVNWQLLEKTPGESWCEWKGAARYWGLVSRPGTGPVAWGYPEPGRKFSALQGWVSFYPARVRCLVDGELVLPQPGGFYGGWITNDVCGPFKGDPGTGHW